MKNNKILLLIAVAVSAISFWAGWMLNPQEVRIETVEIEKEVIKEVKDVRIVKEVVQSPDGTITTKETTEDKTVTDTSKESESKRLELTKRSSPQWKVRVTREIDFTKEVNPEYGVGIERRILGPFFLGAWVTTQKQAGVSVGFEF